MNIIVVGPHGAGKTSVGQALAKRLGVPFHAEIGRELAEDPQWRPAGHTAADRQLAFDDEVMRRELARDANWPAAQPRVVETWHPGNLAYALRRSPDRLAAWWPQLLAAAHRPTLALVLDAPDAVLRARQTEPGDGTFFSTVGRQAPDCCRLLGIPIAGQFDGSAAFRQVLAAALDAVAPACHPQPTLFYATVE